MDIGEILPNSMKEPKWWPIGKRICKLLLLCFGAFFRGIPVMCSMKIWCRKRLFPKRIIATPITLRTLINWSYPSLGCTKTRWGLILNDLSFWGEFVILLKLWFFTGHIKNTYLYQMRISNFSLGYFIFKTKLTPEKHTIVCNDSCMLLVYVRKR